MTRLLTAGFLVGLLSVTAFADAATKLVFTTEPIGGPVGTPFGTQPVVEAQDDFGYVDTAFNGPVTIAITAATKVGGAELIGTKTVNAQQGVAYFENLQITQPGYFALEATSGALTPGVSAGVSVTLTITEVYVKNLPSAKDDGINPETQLSGYAGIRAFAMNANPGSPWKGTIYLPRRHNNGLAGETGRGAVFYWKGDTVLTPTGPDLKNPTGRFVEDTAIYDFSAGNSAWGIAVGGDDYVYVTGLASKAVVRYNPDGTNPVLVIPSGTGFSSGGNLRQMSCTGKGMDTTIWYIDDGKVVAKWTATAVDNNGGPTAFAKTTLFTSNDNSSQHYQLLPNSTRDTIYYGAYMGTTGGAQYSPAKFSFAGVRDNAFPIYTLQTGDALAIDSQDRIVYAGFPGSKRFVPLNPRNGTNLTDDGMGGVLSTGYTPNPSVWVWNYVNGTTELARYSDRHYFYFGCGSTTVPATAGSSTLGVFATNMPAPDAKDVVISNPGLGTNLKVLFTMPNDAELIGADIYRSTVAGALGTKVASKVTSPYTDSGLTAGVTYYYTIRPIGKDPFTAEEYSSASIKQYAGVPVFTYPPEPPSNIKATDTTQGGEILVEWTTPALYADVINIYRSLIPTELGPKVKVVTSPAAGAPASWLDTGLVDGVTYYYTVKAMNGKDEESSNTAKVSASPSDQVAPTFGGLTSAKDYGFPGARLTWTPAVDKSVVSYRVYVSSTYDGFNFSSPFATTSETTYDLRGLTINQPVFLQVKAADGAGNTDTTTKIVEYTPTRIIVDPDVNVPANSANVNVQPDANFPALVPSDLGSGKATAEDLFLTTFAPGSTFLNTNDKLGKVLYTIPINAAGTYNLAENHYNGYGTVIVAAPNVRFSVTKPDGTVLPDVFLNQGGNGNAWNLISKVDLTVGTLTVLVDFTTVTDNTPTNYFVAPVIRAIAVPQPVVIYQAPVVPTIDGNITDAEWGRIPPLVMGRAIQDLIPGNWTGPADYHSYVYLSWDSTRLFFALKATDDVVSFPDTPETQLFFRDGFELYLGLLDPQDPTRTAYDLPGDYQIVISADKDPGTGALTARWYSQQSSWYCSGNPTHIVVKAVPGGYNIEGYLEWLNLDGQYNAPVLNQVIGLNIHANDNDTTTPNQQSAFSLSQKGSSYNNPSNWITATLLGTAPAAVPGDIDRSGFVSIADVQLAQKVAAGLVALDATMSLTNGDVVADGKIDEKDVAKINRMINGL